MIQINNLTFYYPEATSPALKNINLHITPGEFVGIIGPTAAGKTTLTQCLNGIIPHFQEGKYYGEVLVDGQDTVNSNCAHLAGSVGSVFQDPEAQIVSSIVEDEITFGLENQNIPRAEMVPRLEESLALTGITHLRHLATARLSGGQKQRVAIAAAIALRPKILVLDEPTSELDPQGSQSILKTLQKLNQEYQITIVMVEQRLSLLASYTSRLMVMDQGEILLDGKTREVLERQDILQKLGLKGSPVTQLVYQLKQEGFYQGKLPLNVEEAFPVIAHILASKKNLSGGKGI